MGNHTERKTPIRCNLTIVPLCGETIIRGHELIEQSSAKKDDYLMPLICNTCMSGINRIRLIGTLKTHTKPRRWRGFVCVKLFYISDSFKPETVFPFPKNFCSYKSFYIIVYVRKFFYLNVPFPLAPFMRVIRT